MSTYINMVGHGGGGGGGAGKGGRSREEGEEQEGEGKAFGAYAYTFLASPPLQKILCSKTISDMSVPLCLHITEVIPTCHNMLHVERDSVARGRLSKLIDELESGTWLS